MLIHHGPGLVKKVRQWLCEMAACNTTAGNEELQLRFSIFLHVSY